MPANQSEGASCRAMLYLLSGRYIDLGKLAVLFPFMDQSWLNIKGIDKTSSKGIRDHCIGIKESGLLNGLHHSSKCLY